MKKAVKPSSVPTMQVVKQKVRPGKQPKPVAKALVPQQNDEGLSGRFISFQEEGAGFT